jgi:membrane protease YdiL (CAAX protease family)
VVLTLGALVVPGTVASFEPLPPLSVLTSYLILFIYPALIIGGPLGEEPGWRGFALPRLQRHYGPLVGTLILSPLWAFWHVPIWLTAWRAAGHRDRRCSDPVVAGLGHTLFYVVPGEHPPARGGDDVSGRVRTGARDGLPKNSALSSNAAKTVGPASCRHTVPS